MVELVPKTPDGRMWTRKSCSAGLAVESAVVLARMDDYARAPFELTSHVHVVGEYTMNNGKSLANTKQAGLCQPYLLPQALNILIPGDATDGASVTGVSVVASVASVYVPVGRVAVSHEAVVGNNFAEVVAMHVNEDAPAIK